MRVSLYVDVSNLYFCVYNNLRGKLNYAKLLEFIEPLGTLVAAKAYGAQIKDEAEPFIQTLTKLGFTCNYKTPKHMGQKHVGKADWDVGITVDMIKDINDYDMAILATADGDMTPLVEYLMEHDKKIVIIGSNISRELQTKVTKYIEIPDSLVIKRRKDALA